MSRTARQTKRRRPARKLSPEVRDEFGWFFRQARAPRLRGMRRFAEEEIIIPDGPFEGRRFSCDRQPYTRLWFDAVDSGRWNRHCATGPTQSGKTLSCFVIPTLYHLFEVGETVICGVPTDEVAADKWDVDLLPAIEQSRYRDLLPSRGAGSKGGKATTIRFKNGATLKFMSGGGSDKKRAAFTSRVLVVTETDGLDEAGEASREADKLKQLEGRTRAFGSRKRVYLECTVSLETARTWREYQAGTASQIVLRCPGCRAWVCPERDDLVGWQDADEHAEARERSAFACPECGQFWSEAEREAANAGAKLLHKGQSIDRRGRISGSPPRSDTLGFRWSAVHNLFVAAGDVGGDEWRAARDPDEDNAEKEMLQFVWARPYQPPQIELTPLSSEAVRRRARGWRKGMVPEGTQVLTAGIDLGKWSGHWVLLAWMPEVRLHLCEYGIFDVHSEELGVERGILQALREFRELVEAGWPSETGHRIPEQVWIDSGYQKDPVYAFCREAGGRYRPTKGYGAGQRRRSVYAPPRQKSNVVRLISEGYHLTRERADRIDLIHVDANHWKSWLQERLSTPAAEPGALTLYEATSAGEHIKISKHFTAEKEVEEFEPGRGVVTRWETVSRQNHWFDAAYLACAAGHFAGERLVQSRSAPQPTRSNWFAQQRRRAA